MTEIFKTLAKLRELYPDDVARIDEDAKRVKVLMEGQAYAENPITKNILAVCRKEIVNAKKKLSSDKSLLGNEQAQRELWFLIESREWYLDMVSRDYEAELASIEAELASEL